MKKITLFIFVLSSLLGFSQPTTNAPTPTKAPADVVSIYGETYTSIATNFNPNWGQSGFCCVNPAFNPTGVTGTGQNLVLAYPTFNYQGTELTTTNAANMEFLHVDVWTSANPATSTLQVSPINNGTGAGETLVTIPFISGQWTSIDIPKSAFTNMTWNSVFQMKFAANGPNSVVPITIYLDNIYFWKNPIVAGANADLSDLKVNGTTVAGFGPATLTYNIGLPNGTTLVPQITSTTLADPAATQVITQATALPGSATVVVTSQNTLVTKTYTVNYSVVGPAVAAPTPPARPAADVKSIFSDAYAPIATLGYAPGINTFNTDWCPMNTSLVTVQSNNTNLVTGSPCEGVNFIAGRFDATTFTTFHIDIYTDTPTLDKNFTIKFSNWNNGAGEANAILYSANNSNILTQPNTGNWYSFDIPLSSFVFAGGNPALGTLRNDIVEMIFETNLNAVYYDNAYFHKNTVLSVANFEASNIKMYPNPATTSFTIEAQSSVENVTVYNMLGQEVINTAPNSQQAMIDISTLNVGVYIVKASINGVVSSSRLVKE